MWQPGDASTPAELYPRAVALYHAGRLNDALALLAMGEPSQPTGETRPALSILLLRGRILVDQIFHANRGYDEAVASLGQAQVLAEELGEDISALDALDLLAMGDYYRGLQAGAGDHRQLLIRFQQNLERREALGDSRGIAESLFHVGLMHERLDEYDQATEAYERAYTLAKEHGHKLELSYAARHLGGIRLVRRDLDAALASFEESLALRQEMGVTLGLPLAHIAIGDVLLARQEVEQAARHYEQAHALAEGMQSPLAVVFSLLALSASAQARGDEVACRDHAARALSQAQEHDLPLGIRAASATLDALNQEHD